MRQIINSQLQFRQVDISTINFDLKSRNDIPKILQNLQYIYITQNLRESIFALLEKGESPKINKKEMNEQLKSLMPIPKQPYVPPKVTLLPLSSSTLNNSSGGGDGDAALANS